MSEMKPAHKYKPGTTFIYFGVMLGVLGLFGGGAGIAGLMLVAGLVLVIVGVAKKSERRR